MSPRYVALATSSSPKDKFQLSALVREAGFNPSLPAALISAKGELLAANPRMLALLGLEENAKFPLLKERMVEIWPFYTEEDAGPALYKKLLKTHALTEYAAQAALKTHRLISTRLREGIVVIAQVMRSGDLLKDKHSRQELFRALSHEIRTSVTTLSGYTDMLDDELKSSHPKQLLSRMRVALVRLEKVVNRLDELRDEMRAEIER